MSYYVDSENELGDYFLDLNRRISAAHLAVVCKISQKNACRYISGLPIDGGFYVCMKKSPVKEKIDTRVETGKFSAKADNCEGLGEGYDKN